MKFGLRRVYLEGGTKRSCGKHLRSLDREECICRGLQSGVREASAEFGLRRLYLYYKLVETYHILQHRVVLSESIWFWNVIRSIGKFSLSRPKN